MDFLPVFFALLHRDLRAVCNSNYSVAFEIFSSACYNKACKIISAHIKKSHENHVMPKKTNKKKKKCMYYQPN